MTQILERESQEGGGRRSLNAGAGDDNMSNSSQLQLIDRFDDRIDPQLIVRQMLLETRYKDTAK